MIQSINNVEIKHLTEAMQDIISDMQHSESVFLQDYTYFFVKNLEREKAFREMAEYDQSLIFPQTDEDRKISLQFMRLWRGFRFDELAKAIQIDPYGVLTTIYIKSPKNREIPQIQPK